LHAIEPIWPWGEANQGLISFTALIAALLLALFEHLRALADRARMRGNVLEESVRRLHSSIVRFREYMAENRAPLLAQRLSMAADQLRFLASTVSSHADSALAIISGAALLDETVLKISKLQSETDWKEALAIFENDAHDLIWRRFAAIEPKAVQWLRTSDYLRGGRAATRKAATKS
jgi:hypothetical protein